MEVCLMTELDEFVFLRTCNTKQEANLIESALDADGIYPRFVPSKTYSKSTCCSCGAPNIDLLVRFTQKQRAIELIDKMDKQLEDEALYSKSIEEKPKPKNNLQQQIISEEKDQTANVIFNGLTIFISAMVIVGFLIFILSN